MKRKLLSRVSAVAMASAMMVSMFGMSVSAANTPDSNKYTMDFTKVITKQENVYAPNEVFNFSIRPATGQELTSSQGYTVVQGIADGAIMTDTTIISKSDESDIGKTQITIANDKATVEVDGSKFTKTGIYRYVIEEVAGTTEGMTYDTEDRYLDVYVTTDNSGQLTVTCQLVKATDTSAKGNAIFTNDYDAAGNVLHDLKIEKIVAGNQGDQTTDFNFTVTVNGADDEIFYMVVQKDDGDVTYTLEKNKGQSFTLAHNETAYIYGLSESDTYTVVENDADQNGYTTTDSENTSGSISEDTTVTFTNTRNATAPTGIIMNIAPYIILVAFAGIAALVFLRRRNREF